MIVEKFMCLGFGIEQEIIKDVQITNRYQNSYGNKFDVGFQLDCIRDFTSNVVTDHKKFILKNNAINNIIYLKTQYPNVLSWTVIPVYEEIYDKIEQRKYKLLKLKTKINIC